MDTAEPLYTADADDKVYPEDKIYPEEGADAIVEQVLKHVHAFTHKAPFTAVSLFFLAGVGAAVMWNATRPYPR